MSHWRLTKKLSPMTFYLLSHKTCWITLPYHMAWFSVFSLIMVEARGVREGAVVDTMLHSWSVFPQKAHRSNNNEWWETKKKCHQVFLLLKEFRLSTWWILFDKRIKRHVVSRGSNWGCHGLHNRHGASSPYILSPASFLFCLFHVLKWKTGMGNATQIFLLN